MALFNVAWARKMGGEFLLRIEDTDRARFDPGSEQQIYDSLRWLGLTWDEGPDLGGPVGPYRQSERLETYGPVVDQLLADGHAYHCWCSPQRLADLREQRSREKSSATGYDRLCLGMTREERETLPGFSPTPVVRMLIPDDPPLTFQDAVRGEIRAPHPDDQVIRKADGFPTYHLAVVVDDHLMGVTHVVRGEEWISSTPKHLLLYQWLGWDTPEFAHMPLLRNADHSKISKRKNPAARLTWFREQGFLPEALLNFLQLMGFPPAHQDSEVASLAEFIDAFEWSKVNTVGPVFDLDKLTWLNGHYIRALPTEELAARIATHLTETGTWPSPPDPSALTLLTRATPLIRERLTLLSEALPKLAFLFAHDDDITIADDARSQLGENAPAILASAVTALSTVTPFDAASIEAALRKTLVEEMGIKPRLAFAPLRIGLTGERVSPPLFESMEVLGRTSTLTRLGRAAENLS